MARPKVPLISKRKALEVALDIIDNEGIESLSIRRLAERLAVNGASLYHHFTNKDEIVVGAAMLAFEEVRAPEPNGEPWREWVLSLAREMRRAFRAHPDLVPVVLRRAPLSVSVAQLDTAAARLAREEVPTGAIAPMLEALELFAIGSALHERQVGRGRPDPMRTPHLARSAAQRAVSPDEVFDAVCESIIETMMSRAVRSEPGAPARPSDAPAADAPPA